MVRVFICLKILKLNRVYGSSTKAVGSINWVTENKKMIDQMLQNGLTPALSKGEGVVSYPHKMPKFRIPDLLKSKPDSRYRKERLLIVGYYFTFLCVVVLVKYILVIGKVL